LSQRFNTKNLGEMNKILGIRITRDRKHGTIDLDQEQYLRTKLDKFGIAQKKYKPKAILVADYEALRPGYKDETRIKVSDWISNVRNGTYSTRHCLCTWKAKPIHERLRRTPRACVCAFFIPLHLSVEAFHMNFVELDQRSLHIWVWFAGTMPLFTITLVICFWHWIHPLLGLLKRPFM